MSFTHKSPFSTVLNIFGISCLLILSSTFQNCTSGNYSSETTWLNGKYLGDQNCRTCHEQEYNDWRNSDHDLAMQEANEYTILADFNHTEFTSNGVTSKFFKRDGKYFVNTEGSTGEYLDFEILFTFGVRPLQQYMVEFPGGRLQCLLTAWDTEEKKWFDLMPLERQASDDWLHWSKGSMTWNTMCADCHSTNLRKNFTESTNSFQTEYSIIDVSCEACHGPGEKHVNYANSSDYTKGKRIKGSFMLQIPGTVKKKQVDDCARCHSRRGQITKKYDFVGEFMDHYQPSLINQGLYYTDGQILDEVYVYGSFLQSKMYHRDVSCMDCHNSHSLELKFDGNNLCTQCHIKEDYDSPSHHFHQNDTEASLCVNCHMTGKIYMGNDYRRDHSFRVPRPDLSSQFNTPNACNQCHEDQSVQWAEDAVIKWYGPDRPIHFSNIMTRVHAGDINAIPDMIEMVGDTSFPGIIQASAVQILGDIGLPESNQKILESLKNPDPIIRYAAVSALSNASEEDRLRYLSPMLKDSIRSIRTHTVYMLADISEDLFKGPIKSEYLKANIEFQHSLEAQSDFPSGQLMKGQYYHKKGDLLLAEKAYREAFRQDPYLPHPYFNLANILYGRQDFDGAIKQFKMAISRDSNYIEAHYSLGLLYAEINALPLAEKELGKAAILSGNPRYYYNWGLSLQNLDKPLEAEQAFLSGLAIQPNSESILYALTILYIQEQENTKAKTSVNKLIELNPQNPDYLSLSRSIPLK